MKCAAMYNHLSKVVKMPATEVAAKNKTLTTGEHSAPAYCGVRDLFFPPAPSDESAASSSSSSSKGKAPEIIDAEVSVWACEFCNFHNVVALDEEEMPKVDSIDYMIEPPPAGSSVEQNIVFCIDISGSMCVTSEIDSKIHLKGGSKKDANLLRNHGEGDQHFPGQKRNVTYVSRLQCVQAAIEHHITQVSKNQPNTKIGLVTFNDEVTILGDGTQEPVVVSGDKLNSWQQLKEIGEAYHINKAASAAEKDLTQKLWSLEENGSTALGPALLLAILIAVCTTTPTGYWS